MGVETYRAMHHVWRCSCKPWRSHRIHSCLFQKIGPSSLEAREHVGAAAVSGGEMLGAERGRRTGCVLEAEQKWVWESEEKR